MSKSGIPSITDMLSDGPHSRNLKETEKQSGRVAIVAHTSVYKQDIYIIIKPTLHRGDDRMGGNCVVVSGERLSHTSSALLSNERLLYIPAS